MGGIVHDSIISAQDADRLIAAHDGDMALLYIYRLRTGITDTERTAGDLCMTVRAVKEAEEKLNRICSPSAAPAVSVTVPAETETIPQYRTEDIVKRSQEDGDYAAILSEAEKVMGKPLSSVDMKALFGVYDHLGLPTDVIMLLINYCGTVYEQKYGSQRRPTMRAIEKEALSWANHEVLTLDRAEEYIAFLSKRSSAVGQVKDVLGIKNRELVKTELEHINKWLDMGFSTDVIEVAFERTVTNTGSLKWNYMESILKSWYEKKLFTVAEIEEKDGRRPKTNTVTAKTGRALDYSVLDELPDEL